MDIGLSIQLVWPLAAEEALAGKREYIEPAHLLNAILKFAELEEDHLRQLARNPPVVKGLLDERDVVRMKLQEYGILVPELSTKVRRMLRDQLGIGHSAGPRDGILHRSPASRELCRVAEVAAEQSGAAQWTAADLLQALLDAPPDLLDDVLAQVGAPQLRLEETPVLDSYGRDLTALALQGELEPVKDLDTVLASDPLCKVVAQAALGPAKGKTLLIQAGERTPASIVETLAQVFAGANPPVGAKSKRVIQVLASRVGKGAETPSEIESRMAALLDEASQCANIILWLCAFHRYLGADGGADLSAFLKERLQRSAIRCIASTDEENYARLIKPDSVWKSLFTPVWIHDLEVPLQL